MDSRKVFSISSLLPSIRCIATRAVRPFVSTTVASFTSPRSSTGSSLIPYTNASFAMTTSYLHRASSLTVPMRCVEPPARSSRPWPVLQLSSSEASLTSARASELAKEGSVNFHTAARTTFAALAGLTICAATVLAQAPDGPQNDGPPAASAPRSTPAPSSTAQTVLVPAGTRLGVTLENGISTATAKPGDSVYMRTSFPITINNKVVVPVGSYLRGEITDSKRPGRVKGKGELRLRLNTMVLPNGYTVDLNAEPHSTDAGEVKTDQEGKMTGPGGKGKDATTVATTTAAGAGIGAIAGGGKGAGIGAGVGGLAGLAAVLLSRGPEAQLPRGSSLDLVLERDLHLDADQIHYADVGQSNTVVIQQPAPQN